MDGDDVEEAKHRRAAVLNLHDLVPAHVAGLDEAKGVVDAQRREHPDVALREHLDLARAWRRSTVALNCKRSEVAENRLAEVKRSHHVDLSRRRDDTLERRHRPGNRTLAEDAHQTDHCEAAIVDLNLQLLRLPLVTLVLVEAERIVQVQRSRVGQKWPALRVFERPDPRLSFLTLRQIEGREEAGLATPHVVATLPRTPGHRRFGVVLEETDGQEDLPLGFIRDALPKRRRADSWSAQLVAGHLPRKVDAVRVDTVTDEPSHRDAAVLDLGVAQEADGRFVRLIPELTLSKVERVPETDGGVEAFRQSLQVSLRFGPANCQSCDDRRRRSAAQAAGRVERVDAEELVDEAARDAKHSRAAVLALGVELEGPDL